MRGGNPATLLGRLPKGVTAWHVALVTVVLSYVVTATVLMTAWNWHLTNFWHMGIHFEQTSVAVNYRYYGLGSPFSEIHRGLLHLPPLYSWITFLGIEATGWVAVGRPVSLVFGVLTLLVVARLVRSLGYSRSVSLLAVAFLATSPLYLTLGAAIMQETTMLFFSTLAVLVFTRYLHTDDRRYLLGAGVVVFFSAFAKWPGIFTLIPFGLVLLHRERLAVFRMREAYATAALPVGLSLAWFLPLRARARTEPGSTLANRLFFNVEKGLVETVQSMTVHVVTRLPITSIVFAGVALATMDYDDDRSILLSTWLVGGALYYLTFLQGAINHDHYLALALPPLAIAAAVGFHTTVAVLDEAVSLPNVLSRRRVHTCYVAGLIAVVLIGAVYGSVAAGGAREARAVEAETVGERLAETEGAIVFVGKPTTMAYFHLDGRLDRVDFFKTVGAYESSPVEADLLVTTAAEDEPVPPGFALAEEYEYHTVYERSGETEDRQTPCSRC